MSTKIAKFIASALNNSSANEASQALKMAATTMQKEGVNPSDFLQHKSNSNDSRIRKELEKALADATYWRNAYDSKVNNNEELKKAKQVAIRWHKEAQEALESASHFKKAFVEAESNRETLRLRVKRLIIAILLCSLGSVVATCEYLGSNYQDDLNQYVLQSKDLKNKNEKLNNQISVLETYAKKNAQLESRNQQLANEIKAVENKPTISSEMQEDESDDLATCYINGKVFNSENGKYEKVKFIYENGIVISITDGKFEGLDKEKSEDLFLSNVKKSFPGKAYCIKGVVG